MGRNMWTHEKESQLFNAILDNTDENNHIDWSKVMLIMPDCGYNVLYSKF